ncbi:hypothetical protein SADO_04045 [Salinisphaera dokdonensis CL-ES53]|uniref:Uncharacterized protein n=1 Tax=Salinisphaera dokdonensis CL-ES53 TaxID=1304272 RepID=A0ABV2AXS2_9GAMM
MAFALDIAAVDMVESDDIPNGRQKACRHFAMDDRRAFWGDANPENETEPVEHSGRLACAGFDVTVCA